MRLKPGQWSGHLQGKLASVYGLFSDEPLLLQEAEEALCQVAAEQGFAQRQRLNHSSAPWDALRDERDAGSLFAEQRLLLLRLDSIKLPKEGISALQYWLASPPPMPCSSSAAHAPMPASRKRNGSRPWKATARPCCCIVPKARTGSAG